MPCHWMAASRAVLLLLTIPLCQPQAVRSSLLSRGPIVWTSPQYLFRSPSPLGRPLSSHGPPFSKTITDERFHSWKQRKTSAPLTAAEAVPTRQGRLEDLGERLNTISQHRRAFSPWRGKRGQGLWIWGHEVFMPWMKKRPDVPGWRGRRSTGEVEQYYGPGDGQWTATDISPSRPSNLESPRPLDDVPNISPSHPSNLESPRPLDDVPNISPSHPSNLESLDAVQPRPLEPNTPPLFFETHSKDTQQTTTSSRQGSSSLQSGNQLSGLSSADRKNTNEKGREPWEQIPFSTDDERLAPRFGTTAERGGQAMDTDPSHDHGRHRRGTRFGQDNNDVATQLDNRANGTARRAGDGAVPQDVSSENPPRLDGRQGKETAKPQDEDGVSRGFWLRPPPEEQPDLSGQDTRSPAEHLGSFSNFVDYSQPGVGPFFQVETFPPEVPSDREGTNNANAILSGVDGVQSDAQYPSHDFDKQGFAGLSGRAARLDSGSHGAVTPNPELFPLLTALGAEWPSRSGPPTPGRHSGQFHAPQQITDPSSTNPSSTNPSSTNPSSTNPSSTNPSSTQQSPVHGTASVTPKQAGSWHPVLRKMRGPLRRRPLPLSITSFPVAGSHPHPPPPSTPTGDPPSSEHTLQPSTLQPLRAPLNTSTASPRDGLPRDVGKEELEPVLGLNLGVLPVEEVKNESQAFPLTDGAGLRSSHAEVQEDTPYGKRLVRYNEFSVLSSQGGISLSADALGNVKVKVAKMDNEEDNDNANITGSERDDSGQDSLDGVSEDRRGVQLNLERAEQPLALSDNVQPRSAPGPSGLPSPHNTAVKISTPGFGKSSRTLAGSGRLGAQTYRLQQDDHAIHVSKRSVEDVTVNLPDKAESFWSLPPSNGDQKGTTIFFRDFVLTAGHRNDQKQTSRAYFSPTGDQTNKEESFRDFSLPTGDQKNKAESIRDLSLSVDGNQRLMAEKGHNGKLSDPISKTTPSRKRRSLKSPATAGHPQHRVLQHAGLWYNLPDTRPHPAGPRDRNDIIKGAYSASNPQRGGYSASNPQRGEGYSASNPQRDEGYSASNPQQGGYSASNPQQGEDYSASNAQRGGAYPASKAQRGGAYPASNAQRGGAYSASKAQRGGAYSASKAQRGGAYSASNAQRGGASTANGRVDHTLLHPLVRVPLRNREQRFLVSQAHRQKPDEARYPALYQHRPGPTFNRASQPRPYVLNTGGGFRPNWFFISPKGDRSPKVPSAGKPSVDEETTSLKPTEPQTTSTELPTNLSEPRINTNPSKPQTNPVEPRTNTNPTEPRTNPSKPRTNPSEPQTNPSEPRTNPPEPRTDPSEPRTTPTHPPHLNNKDDDETTAPPQREDVPFYSTVPPPTPNPEMENKTHGMGDGPKRGVYLFFKLLNITVNLQLPVWKGLNPGLQQQRQALSLPHPSVLLQHHRGKRGFWWERKPGSPYYLLPMGNIGWVSVLNHRFHHVDLSHQTAWQ